LQRSIYRKTLTNNLSYNYMYVQLQETGLMVEEMSVENLFINSLVANEVYKHF